MINISKVSDWLTQNANEHLYPRLFLMSPNGTLLAYSKPVQTKELRDQAALISMAWKEHCNGRERQLARTAAATDHSLKSPLKTLTIETEYCNIIARLIQPELLLVLIGKISLSRRQAFKITAEGDGDARYPDADVPASRPDPSSRLLQGDAAGELSEGNNAKKRTPSILSNMSQRDRDIRTGPLHIQRKRLDALAGYILKDFEETGFVMPADADLQ